MANSGSSGLNNKKFIKFIPTLPVSFCAQPIIGIEPLSQQFVRLRIESKMLLSSWSVYKLYKLFVILIILDSNQWYISIHCI